METEPCRVEPPPGRPRPLLQMRRPAFPLAQPLQRVAEDMLRRRPVERHPIARPLLERLVVGGDRRQIAVYGMTPSRCSSMVKPARAPPLPAGAFHPGFGQYSPPAAVKSGRGFQRIRRNGTPALSS